MRRNGKILLTALLIYIALLFLLVAAESDAPGSSIHSFWEPVR